MRTNYTDAELQEYRHRLVVRLNATWAKFPGQENEAAHERWSKIFRIWYSRYEGIEAMLIERGVELEPLRE